MKSSTRKPRSFDIAASAPERSRENAEAASGSHKKKRRKPRAIEPGPALEFLPDDAIETADAEAADLTPPPPPPMRRRWSWGKLALAAFSALAALALGLTLDAFIRDLFARNDWLGWAALALASIGIFAVLALVIREWIGLYRLRSLQSLRLDGEKARESDDLKAARRVALKVVALYEDRPETAHGRTLLSEHAGEIMGGADLIHLLERDLLAHLDRSARSHVMSAAKRVSVVTAVSPRAVVDILYVLYENTRLVRRIAEHYGGRPGFLSSIGLMRRVLTHLAATGAIAIGEGLLQQMIGHGLAARLSARLGEGVVNGLLTARIGIAAIDVCRPLEFEAEKRPGVNEFLSELVRFGGSAPQAGSAPGERQTGTKADRGDTSATK